MNITFTPQPIPELTIGGDWITDAEQLEITAVPGVIRLQRREV